jgi:ribonuclease D
VSEPVAAPLWIDSASALAAGCRRWREGGRVALDTEFVFERTFYPRLGLVQVAAAGEVALIDTVALPDLGALAPLLADPAVEKVAHAAAQDVAVLARAAGAAPARLLDTQVAAAFVGFGAAISYAALVETLLGVALGKHETRTDWLRRPLSPAQLRYAAEDVVYLPEAAARLEARLDELGRRRWAEEESQRALAAALERPEPEESWRRVRGIQRLPPAARRVARALAAWRERAAEAEDLARPFLLRDETLLALARREELDPEAAARLPGYDPRRHAAHVAAWRRALAEARACPAPAGEPPEPRPSAAEIARGRELAELVSRRAAALGLPAELLLPRRDRERLARLLAARAPLAGALPGWRGEALAADLAEPAGAARGDSD